MHPNIHYSTIFSSQNLEETHMSIDRWMNKEDMACVCVCDKILSSKKEWNDVICSKVDWPRDCHTNEMSKYHMTSLMYSIFLNDTNELVYRTEVDL